jgi:predicted peptidase
MYLQIRGVALAAALCLLTAGGLPVAAQTITVDNFQAGSYTDPLGNTLPYRLYVPKNYDPARQYPLVLFLHGAGERGTDNRLQLTGQTGELAYVNQAPADTFMLAPQCPTNDQWVEVPFSQGSYSIANTPISPSLQTALSLQSSLLKQYSIDPTRLYITGLSMGGYGAWDLSLRYPTLYAATIPMSGAGDPDRAALLLATGVWAFHGALDGTVPVSGSRDMIGAIEASGGSPLYTEYPTGGHIIWDTAYATPDLIPWTFAQHRTLVEENIVPEPGVMIWAAAIVVVTVVFTRGILFRKRRLYTLAVCATSGKGQRCETRFRSGARRRTIFRT